MFYVFSFPPGVYVGTLNLIASIPGSSMLTMLKMVAFGFIHPLLALLANIEPLPSGHMMSK